MTDNIDCFKDMFNIRSGNVKRKKEFIILELINAVLVFKYVSNGIPMMELLYF